MTNFLLPNVNNEIYEKIKYSEPKELQENPVFISNSLSFYLSNIKERITDNEILWDIFKKYTNPYEYIHTPVPMIIPYQDFNERYIKHSIAKYRPISRSYFKMIEMIKIFKLIPEDTSNEINTFHLAEGPGGFIEALATLRLNIKDKYIGMTLQNTSKDMNIPAWKKSKGFLNKYKNVILENGIDGTGNILVLDNLLYCKEKYGSKMDIITGDGGFDFSTDFNYQEIFISKLLFAQVAFAITMQKEGGCFILKIFDSFMKHTLDIQYILSSFYENVHIIKPQTSRYANSEKYLICKNFRYKDNHFFPFIERCFIEMMKTDKEVPCRFLDMEIPFYFIQKIEEFNAIFGQKQIQNIHYTLSLIDNKYKQDKIDSLIQTNMQKSIDWCIRFDVPC
jgi:23S rRNA U2552 (ribose-2'-O)-methylase RlmE/FtsJ